MFGGWVGVGMAGPEFLDREALEQAVSDNGTVTLSWASDTGSPVVLEQASEIGFGDAVVRYEGRDPGTVLTGLPEGEHFFRIGTSGQGDWSPPLGIQVRFFDRATLRLLLGLGAVVVVATILAIVSGFLRSRSGKEGIAE